MMYKINGDGTVVFKIEGSLNIPADENNRHYQEYLAWVAEGNVAEILPEETYD